MDRTDSILHINKGKVLFGAKSENKLNLPQMQLPCKLKRVIRFVQNFVESVHHFVNKIVSDTIMSLLILDFASIPHLSHLHFYLLTVILHFSASTQLLTFRFSTALLCLLAPAYIAIPECTNPFCSCNNIIRGEKDKFFETPPQPKLAIIDSYKRMSLSSLPTTYQKNP